MDPPVPRLVRSGNAGLRRSGPSRPRRFAVAEPGRLDVCLAAALEVSRAEARRLLAGGGVSLDGRPVSERDKGARLEAGAELAVAAFTPPDRRRPRPEPGAELTILAEGPGWLAVDKPAGRPVHPFAENESGTVLNAVLARRPEIFGVGEGGLRSGVVHRLDVDTSGVLLFATEARSWRRLRRAFATAAVHKRYRAIVLGEPAGRGSLEVDLCQPGTRWQRDLHVHRRPRQPFRHHHSDHRSARAQRNGRPDPNRQRSLYDEQLPGAGR